MDHEKLTALIERAKKEDKILYCPGNGNFYHPEAIEAYNKEGRLLWAVEHFELRTYETFLKKETVILNPSEGICLQCKSYKDCEEKNDGGIIHCCSHFSPSKIEGEEIPKELFALISYIGEMKRNHLIMAGRIDNLEKTLETLRRKIAK